MPANSYPPATGAADYPRVLGISSGGSGTVVQVAALDDDHAALAIELANDIDRKHEFVDYPLTDDHELSRRLLYHLTRASFVEHIRVEPFAAGAACVSQQILERRFRLAAILGHKQRMQAHGIRSVSILRLSQALIERCRARDRRSTSTWSRWSHRYRVHDPTPRAESVRAGAPTGPSRVAPIGLRPTVGVQGRARAAREFQAPSHDLQHRAAM